MCLEIVSSRPVIFQIDTSRQGRLFLRLQYLWLSRPVEVGKSDDSDSRP